MVPHRIIWFLIAGLLVAAYVVGGYFIVRRAQRTPERAVPSKLRERLHHEDPATECAAAAEALRWHIERWLNMHDRRYPPEDFDPRWLTNRNAYDLDVGDLNDPWGRPYLVITPGRNGRRFDIVSYGADGRRGGEGENRDIIR